jgi:hypothetical protein
MATLKSSIYFSLALLFAVGLNDSFAQKASPRETMQFDLQFGGSVIHRATQANNPDIDFLNYLHGGTGNSKYGVMSFGFSLSPNEKWTFATGFSMLSDLLPNQMQVKAIRNIDSLNPRWDWGVEAQLYLYSQYIDEFNQFHIQSDTGLIGDLSSNYRQRTLYDLGMSALPFLKYNGRRMHVILATGLGLNSFLPFNEVIAQKKPVANFRREIRYETFYKPTLTSHTEVEGTFELYKNGPTSLGIILKATLLMGYRHLPYERTILTWTEDNRNTMNIHPKNRFYSKSDISGGMFLKF